MHPPDPLAPAIRLLEPAGSVRLRIAALGDVAFIGKTRERARLSGYDSILSAVAPALQGADLAFANLESPIGAASWVRPDRSPEFWQEPETAKALVRAGVRLVSLANNHMMDCGPAGLLRTREVCLEAGLHPIGAGRNLEEARTPATLMIGGQRVIALAYAATTKDAAGPDSKGVAPLEPEILREDLARLRPVADVLLVSVHWGSMYVDYPPPRVLELARLLASADVVLGTHPHVLQGYRRSGSHLTLFSMGDACFDPGAGELVATVASERRRESGVFTVHVADESGLDCVPLWLDPDGVPGLCEPARAEAQARRIRALADGLDQGGDRFASDSAPVLVRYELESLVSYLRQGRIDRALRLVSGLRPRHLPVLWQALRRMGRSA